MVLAYGTCSDASQWPHGAGCSGRFPPSLGALGHGVIPRTDTSVTINLSATRRLSPTTTCELYASCLPELGPNEYTETLVLGTMLLGQWLGFSSVSSVSIIIHLYILLDLSYWTPYWCPSLLVDHILMLEQELRGKREKFLFPLLDINLPAMSLPAWRPLSTTFPRILFDYQSF